jgi:hypothetical protein
MEDQPIQGKKSNKTIVVIIIFIVILGAAGAVYYFTQSEEAVDTTATTNTAVTTNTEETTTNSTAPTSDAKQYDGKTFNISSADGKIEGLAGIKIGETDGYEYVKVGFFFKITDTFTQKATNLGNTHYSLLAGHMKSNETRVGQGRSPLGGIYCEKDVMPDILEIADGNILDETMRYIECTYGTTDAWEDADMFETAWGDAFSPSVFTLQDIYDLNKLEIYDSSQYWVEEIVDGLESSGVDEETTVANAPILATYTLEYEEQ